MRGGSRPSGGRGGRPGGNSGSNNGGRSGGSRGGAPAGRGGGQGGQGRGGQGGSGGSSRGGSDRAGQNRSGQGRSGANRDDRRDDRKGGFNRDDRRDDRKGGFNRDDRKGGFNRDDRRDDRRGLRRDDKAGGFSRPRRDEGRESAESRTEAQTRYDGPPLPEEITGKELDHNVLAQLKGMPEKLAIRVARHLAAAGAVLDEDPETAYQHTLAARARAARLGVVREAVGETAYAAGHYDVALAELRAAKRINGRTDYLAVMADCHRALGQPDKALKLAKSPGVKNFSSEQKAEMTIVEAGARRDMGQMDAALRTLELAPIHSKAREHWVVRLRYAYADALEAAGKPVEALAWFHRTHAVDADEVTDAAQRAETLEAKRD